MTRKCSPPKSIHDIVIACGPKLCISKTWPVCLSGSKMELVLHGIRRLQVWITYNGIVDTTEATIWLWTLPLL